MTGNLDRNIMIVEDEHLIARDLALIVKHLGYRVSAVIDNGREALEAAMEHRPDLVLMDIVLAGDIDGIDVALMLRERHKLGIVFVTSYADEDTIQRAKKSEPLGYVLKPFNEREIQTAIEIALHKAEMEAKLHMQQELLSSILRSVEDAVIAVDRDGIVQFVNPVAAHMTGFTGAEAEGKNLHEILTIKRYGSAIPSSELLDVITTLSRSHEGPTELVLGGADGRDRTTEFVIRQNVSPYALPSGFVMTFRDITDRKRMEAQMLDVRKMEAVGRLAGGVAHDFNNMMGVILGFASMIKHHPETRDLQRRGADAILEAAQRCSNLTAMLSALAGKGLAHPITLNVNTALSSLRESLSAAAGDKIQVNLIPGKDLWNIKIDVNQLYQALTMLANHSRESMGNSGVLTMTTQNVVIVEESGRVPSPRGPGHFVLVSMSDTGKGMDDALKQRIFEPFFTTKTFGEEPGLGLAVVYGIVKQHKGWIDVQSALGQGTTFNLYFPRYSGLAEEPSGAPGDQDTRGTETILLVEDERLLLAILTHELQDLGYRVLPASSPDDAIILCEQHHQEIQMLVTDLVMPQMNGKELQERIESMRPGLRSLVISGYTADVVAKDGIVEGDLNFLQKPFTPLELARKMREVLDKK